MMDTWMKIGILSPYAIIILGIVGYFFRKKDSSIDNDHTLLLDIKNRVQNIEKTLTSDKGKWIFYMEEVETHERWLTNICQAIRQIKIFHFRNHDKENIDVDELIKRPENLKH